MRVQSKLNYIFSNYGVMIKTLMLICLLVFSARLSAQKWTEVSKEDLAMTSIPEDPEADAVILFDRGELNITPEFEMEFKRHRRIKILTETGKKYADISIAYWHEDKIHKIKAQTLLPGGKNIKLNNKDIFEKENQISKEKVFAIPGVEVGSIIEYSYEKYSEYIAFLEPWYFQNQEYTRLSELVVILPAGFNYSVFISGITGSIGEPEMEKIVNPHNPHRPLRKFTWKLENLAAIKQEPYMTTIDDYRLAVYFQLTSYKDQYIFYQFIKSWDDLAQKVRERYEEYLNEDGGLKKQVLEIIAGMDDDRQKAISIYDYVKNNFETDSYKGFMNNQLRPPHEVVKDKKGSGVEKNLLLINLLRHAGFKAYPFLISTRENGKFRDQWVQLQQFNHTIASLCLDTKTYLLDTQNQCCPFGTLPANDLSEKGLLINDDRGIITSIPAPNGVNMRHASTVATLTADGELVCQSILRYEGYRGMELRTILSYNSSDDYIKELLEEKFSDVTIDSFHVSDVNDLESPLTLTIHYRLHNYARIAGDMIYLMPSMLFKFNTNPFKREKRTFPVEYNYRQASTEELQITIPDNLQVIEIPKPANFQSNSLRFTSKCDSDSNMIHFQNIFLLKKSTYLPNEYAELRDAYEYVISSGQRQAVLKQNN